MLLILENKNAGSAMKKVPTVSKCAVKGRKSSQTRIEI